MDLSHSPVSGVLWSLHVDVTDRRRRRRHNVNTGSILAGVHVHVHVHVQVHVHYTYTRPSDRYAASVSLETLQRGNGDATTHHRSPRRQTYVFVELQCYLASAGDTWRHVNDSDVGGPQQWAERGGGVDVTTASIVMLSAGGHALF